MCFKCGQIDPLQLILITFTSSLYPLLLTTRSIFLHLLSISSPSIFSTLISHPSLFTPADPASWPCWAGQLQLWPAVRRLRQRLSVTPTGSQQCLAVVLSSEWRVQSARRGGEPLTPWLLPELALSPAQVSTEGLSSCSPHTSRSPLLLW